MSNYRLPSTSPHAIHSGRTGTVSGNSGSGGVPLSGVPFVQRHVIATGAQTNTTLIPAGGLQHDFRIIDGWLNVSTAGGNADNALTIQLTSGGTVIGGFTNGSSTGRIGPRDTASEVGRVSQSVTANSTNGLFYSKTGTSPNNLVGELFLVCVRD